MTKLGTGVDPGLGIDLNFESLEGIIQNRGMQVLHEIGIPCPCRTVDTRQGFVGSSEQDCPSCLGRGFVWRDPVLLQALITNLTFTRELATAGWTVPGDLTLTPSQQEREIGDFDRVTILVPIGVDPQIIVRGQKSALTPRPKGLESNEDFLFWQAGEKAAIWVEDEDAVPYKYPQYELEGRKIIWTEESGPAVGKRFVVKYRAHQEYIVYQRPLARYDRGRSLGQRVLLRRIGIPGEGERRQITAPWQERMQNNITRNPYQSNLHSQGALTPTR